MTIAEQLIQRGRDESAEALRQAETEKHRIALNFLHSGLSIEFVAQNTQIDIETLKKLLAEKPPAH